MQIKMLRNTVVEGRCPAIGEIVTVVDRVGLHLVNLGKAERVMSADIAPTAESPSDPIEEHLTIAIPPMMEDDPLLGLKASAAPPPPARSKSARKH